MKKFVSLLAVPVMILALTGSVANAETTTQTAAPTTDAKHHPIKPAYGPNKKPLLSQSKALLTNVYHYNGEGRKTITSPGGTQFAVLVSQHSPYRNTTNAGHTLWEMYAHDNSGNGVEIGWTKEFAVCGQSTNPCFFAYTQINDAGQGYAGIDNPGWVDNPNVNNINANTALAFTTAGADPTSYYQYRIERTAATLPSWQTSTGAGWNVLWKPQAGSDTIVGYFPDSHWGANAFTKFLGAWQWLEIIDVSDDTPCDDAGYGTYGVSTTPSASFKHVAMSIGGAPAGTTNTYDTITNTPSTDSPNAWRFWNDPSDLDWIRAGGPGFAGPVNSSSTSAGSIGSGGC